MLKEYVTEQVAGEPRRRWFSDPYFDLFVWTDAGGVCSFQLCYDKSGRERALTWSREGGFRHDAVDDGESCGTRNRSPVLAADGPFRCREVLERFEAASEAVEEGIRSAVIERLGRCG